MSEGTQDRAAKPENQRTASDQFEAISEKKLNANRENAKKSTGPRTLGGKAYSRRNAIKHGLFARGAPLGTRSLPSPDLPHSHLKEAPRRLVWSSLTALADQTVENPSS